MKQQIQNRTLFIRDNIEVLRRLNSESVDLIYIDPPFNSNRTYEAPIGSAAEGGSFKDIWTLDDVEQEWIEDIKAKNKALHALLKAVGHIGSKRVANSNQGYLQYMSVRLIEIHRILKPTGSIYLHCDTKMSHSLKMVMDCIFSEGNFRNEIIWHYFKPHSSKRSYPKNYDNLLYYVKDDKTPFTFNHDAVLVEYDDKAVKRYDKKDKDGKRYKIYKRKDGSIGKAYMKAGKAENVFKIPFVQGTSKERTGYPTQKPLALLERIIKASSNEGDVVLDAFCGCATTLVASEKLGRQWIGIDVSKKAVELVEQRMTYESEKAENNLFEWGQGKYKTIVRQDIPARTDVEKVVIPNIKETLYKVQEHKCNGCLDEFATRNLEIDHILPRSKGGQDNKDNLQLLCGWCNRVKGDRPQEYLKTRIREYQSNGLVY